MTAWSQMKSLWRNLLRRRAVEEDLEHEVRAYVDMVADEKLASGAGADDARRMALAEFGRRRTAQAIRTRATGGNRHCCTCCGDCTTRSWDFRVSDC